MIIRAHHQPRIIEQLNAKSRRARAIMAAPRPPFPRARATNGRAYVLNQWCYDGTKLTVTWISAKTLRKERALPIAWRIKFAIRRIIPLGFR